MKRSVLAAFLALAVILVNAPIKAEAQSATPSPPPGALMSDQDTAVMARAKEWLHRLQTGDVDRTQLDETMNTKFTPEIAKEAAAQYGPLGDPTNFAYLGKQSVPGGMTAYVYRVTFKAGSFNEIFVLNKDGKVSGIRLPAAP